MNKTVVTSLAALGVFLSVALSGTAGGSVVVDRVVAVVNDDIITMSDLQREEALRQAVDKPDQRLLLEDMIDRKLQMAAAKRAGMSVTDKELADAIVDIKKRNSLDDAAFAAALAREGTTLEQYKAELREQMTLSRAFGKYVRSGIAVDEAEVRAYYERNSAAYALPEEIRVRQIYFREPERASAAQAAAIRDKARAAYERAARGEDFVKLVRELSEGENAGQGGDLGFMQRGHALPEIEEATRGLAQGGIAGPLHCAGGYHIIKLEEVRTPHKPFDKVRTEITNSLYQEKLENTYRSWLQTLRSDSHIENRL
jgi:parvulin-like peptidyl-prolyl isomerase